MKILASADVHGVRAVYDWLLAAACEQRVQAIILAGDLLGGLDGFKTPEAGQEHEAAVLRRVLKAAGVPVFYIMGNDDLVELNSRFERVKSIQGRRVQCGAYNFVGYQYSLPFVGGSFEKPEEDIRTDLASLAALMDVDTVFVSHTPVHGILDPGFGEARIGSRAMAEFLGRNPFRAHIHGHSHAGFGRAGKHFNVAAAGRARAMVLDLKTMEHAVLGRSDTGAM